MAFEPTDEMVAVDLDAKVVLTFDQPMDGQSVE
jgi:hypothetical protein